MGDIHHVFWLILYSWMCIPVYYWLKAALRCCFLISKRNLVPRSCQPQRPKVCLLHPMIRPREIPQFLQLLLQWPPVDHNEFKLQVIWPQQKDTAQRSQNCFPVKLCSYALPTQNIDQPLSAGCFKGFLREKERERKKKIWRKPPTEEVVHESDWSLNHRTAPKCWQYPRNSFSLISHGPTW